VPGHFLCWNRGGGRLFPSLGGESATDRIGSYTRDFKRRKGERKENRPSGPYKGERKQSHLSIPPAVGEAGPKGFSTQQTFSRLLIRRGGEGRKGKCRSAVRSHRKEKDPIPLVTSGGRKSLARRQGIPYYLRTGKRKKRSSETPSTQCKLL